MATVTASLPIPASPATYRIPTLPVYQFSVDQYVAMTEAGILGSDDRVELIDGWIVPKMSKTPPHPAAANALMEAIRRLLPDGWVIHKEDPIVLEGSVPEPDLSVIRGQPADFRRRHPRPDEVALVVEVAESSLPRDRGEKWRAYAKGGVSPYWLINLIDMVVEVYSEPTTSVGISTFARSTIYHPGELLPLVLDGVEVGRVAVSEILP